MGKRRLCMGDIHGAYKAMKQCLERANFDKDKDQLIVLGDVCDGWPETKKCIDELMKVKDLIYIIGNHDGDWFLDYLKTGRMPKIWTDQGGRATIASFNGVEDLNPYIKFLEKAHLYHITEDNKLFVHGGIMLGQKQENWKKDLLVWDRDLFNYVKKLWHEDKEKEVSQFSEIYIGHTTTYHFSTKPIKMCNVWAMDTGAGWEGKLSLLDIDSKEYWQSDQVSTLYPVATARR